MNMGLSHLKTRSKKKEKEIETLYPASRPISVFVKNVENKQDTNVENRTGWDKIYHIRFHPQIHALFRYIVKKNFVPDKS